MQTGVAISAIGETDLDEVSHFLRRTFGASEDKAPFQAQVIRWKALTPHPLWKGSRGYAIRRNGEIVAHGCVVPTRLVSVSGVALVACVIDWAASKSMPGGGLAIYQHVAQLSDALIGVGGSGDAQRVLPRIGFKVGQDLETYARVKKPLALFLESGAKSWRDAARLGRNLMRGLRPVAAATGNWSARQVAHFDKTVGAIMPKPGVIAETICYRDAEMLNYFLLCPAAQMAGYLLESAGVAGGYLILATIHGECRIADLWVNSPEVKSWAAAYLVACNLAGKARQILVGCGTDAVRRSAGMAGFHVAGRQPVYVKDPRRKLPEMLNAALGMMDTDAFYL